MQIARPGQALPRVANAEGVTDVDISLASGDVTVRYDEHVTSPVGLQDIVTNTGFGSSRSGMDYFANAG